MSDQQPGLGTLFLEAMFKSFDDLKSTLTSNVIPKFKRLVKNITFGLIILFVASFILIIFGTTSETKIYTVLGRCGLILTGVLFFFAATPIGYVFAGRKYITFIRSFAIYQIFITFIIWISPMPVSASLLFGLSFAGTLLALINALENKPGALRIFTTIIFAALMVTTYLPSIRDKTDSLIISINEPALVPVNPGDLKAGSVRFFLKGEPCVWYHETSDGKYELFDHAGFHDIYQVKLKPINPTIVEKLIKNEDLISPRNLKKKAFRF